MANKRGGKKAPLPGWIWLTTGLLIGLFVAFLVYIKNNYQGGSVSTVEAGPGKTDARAVRKEQADTLPPPPTRTKFDFYTILPEMEVAVPDEDIEKESKKAGSTTPVEKGAYILQAGAFRKSEQAERMKASLALIGIEANVQTVTIDGSETWHRVRIGPYTNLEKLNQVRARLRENNINAMLLRIKT